MHICIKTSGRFKINTIRWCTKIHDFILIMLKRLISDCCKCSSFVVIHVSSGVDDICTVLSNQTNQWHSIHTMLIRDNCNFNVRVCDTAPDRSHKLQDCIHITISHYNITKHERRRCKYMGARTRIGHAQLKHYFADPYIAIGNIVESESHFPQSNCCWFLD